MSTNGKTTSDFLSWRIFPVVIAPLLAMILLTPAPATAQFGVGVAITIAPPSLPVYAQPICPGPDFIWVPGYWAWGDDDYFWVPGTWVLAPEPGLFWTPGYWAWGGSGFIFTAGYWGPVVGFYGGINYGFGYFGHGYDGGRWDHGHFFYNRAVNNVNVNVIHNTYNTTVLNSSVNVTRVSYNGGNGGVTARPTAQEEAAAREKRAGPVAAQTQQLQAARSDTRGRASVNHGTPPIAATPKAGEFKNANAAAEREAGKSHEAGRPPKAASNGSAEAGSSRPIHPSDLPTAKPMIPPSTGDAKLDRKYQNQQDKLALQQAKDMQKLQQKQNQEHAKMGKQQPSEAQKQQMETRHQQQTQQMTERHAQQTENLQNRQQSHAASASHATGEHAQPKPPGSH
jgi:hypothetical protein